MQWRNGLSSTYPRSCEDGADNGFRQGGAGRSFRFQTLTEVCMTRIRSAWCMPPTNPIGKPTRDFAHRSAMEHTLIGRRDDEMRFPSASTLSLVDRKVHESHNGTDLFVGKYINGDGSPHPPMTHNEESSDAVFSRHRNWRPLKSNQPASPTVV